MNSDISQLKSAPTFRVEELGQCLRLESVSDFGQSYSHFKITFPRLVSALYILHSKYLCAHLLSYARYVTHQASFEFEVWLTVHRSSMWNKKPTIYHLVLYLFISISPCKLLNMFRATLCPSSGADDLVVFFLVWCSAVAL